MCDCSADFYPAELTKQEESIMKNISRRDFFKCAGALTLAVASAGILAGCSGSTGKTKSVKINLTASDTDLKSFNVTKAEDVVATADQLSAEYVANHLPTGFQLVDSTPYKITSDERGYHVDAKTKVADDYSKVTVIYKADDKELETKQYLVLPAADTSVKKEDLKLPDGYKLAADSALTYAITSSLLNGKTVTIDVKTK